MQISWSRESCGISSQDSFVAMEYLTVVDAGSAGADTQMIEQHRDVILGVKYIDKIE